MLPEQQQDPVSPLSSAAYFAMWQTGELPRDEALSAMCADLELLEAALGTMTIQRDKLLQQIGQMVEQPGGMVTVPGSIACSQCIQPARSEVSAHPPPNWRT